MKKQILSIIMAGCLLLSMTACSSDKKNTKSASEQTTADTSTSTTSPQEYSKTDFVMSTVLSEKIYGTKDVTQDIKEELDKLEKEQLSWREDSSVVSKINADAQKGTKTKLDSDMTSWVEDSLELARRSNGAFDPTIGRLTRLWNIEGDNPKVPSKQEVKNTLKDTGYTKIHLEKVETQNTATTKKNVDKDNLGVSDDIANKYGKTDIVNIALFGVDTRDKDSFSGRSDSIMIVSIDKAKNDVKLISVLRDSYVAIDGHGNQKITHAYAYGGAELAIKTLNQNFNMNITDYATINFYKLAEAIDILGGIDIDITEDERLELNNIGDDDNPNFQYVEKSGMVHLTGEQASVYSRIRKRDSDNARVDRQKKVIECLIDKARNISPTKYADLVKAGMALCETSMSVSEVLSFAPMLSNDITIETMVVPGDEDNAVGGIYDGAWVWRYDLAAAADRMHLFIYGEVPETTASSKKKQESQTTTKSSKSSSSATKSSGSSNGGSKSKSSATTSAKHSGGNNKSETTTKPQTTAEATVNRETTKEHTTAEPKTTASSDETKSAA